MNYENFKPGFNKPTIITGQQYGIKVSVELDHSDTDIDELFDAFQTLVVGLGYHESAWKQWVIDRADEYNEEDNESAKDMGMYEPSADLKKAVEDYVASLPKVNEEEEDNFFGPYDSDEKRMDIIGQNGNEGLHYDKYTTKCYCGHTDKCDCAPEDDDRYRATDEDEAEFDDYGQRVVRPTFEWGDEPEDNWFDGEEYKPNEELIEGKKKYDNALKALTKKQKQNDNKTKKRNTKG